ncbi:IS66 family transposase [Deefgea salmonis]|uniref:IS66 family transposase n=1 Tax=Deefgea salmonis TaxID=2875502 RepID=A0ABS8BG62_9NEIS|nr:IS66 family transposase [Deefgea salmonis]MCB5194693.1 IS66 family transposase [Deefgea salmonis]
MPLAESTLASWVGSLSWWLQPLADRLHEPLNGETVLHADETPVKQLDPDKGCNIPFKKQRVTARHMKSRNQLHQLTITAKC